MMTRDWFAYSVVLLLALGSAASQAVTILPEGYDPSHKTERLTLALQEEPALASPSLQPIAMAEPSKEAKPRVVINLKKPSFVPQGQIQLKDVGEIKCEDPVLLADLRSIDLGEPPAPGKSTYVYPRRIEAALRHLGLENGDFDIKGPDRVAIVNPSQEISMDTIEVAINAAFAARDKESHGGQTEAILLHRPPDLHLPPGELNIEVADLDRPGSGIRNVQLKFLVNGKLADTQTFGVRANHKVPAILAARDLESGGILTRKDLAKGLVPSNDNSSEGGALPEPAALIGASLKHGVQSGKPITAKDVELIPLCKKGKPVEVIRKVGNVSLSLSGTLQEDLLYVGQDIKVKTKKSKKDLIGKAVSPAAVELR
jgi:flagella basal body P-ring formation protein FlgA